MSLKKLCWLFLLLLNFRQGVQAQTAAETTQQKLDSLGRELKQAKHDTDRIKIKYGIGITEKNTRMSYWDSLLAKAQNAGLPLFECKIYDQKIAIAYQKKSMPDAIALCNEQLRIAEKNGCKSEVFKTIKYLIGFYSQQYDREQTLQMIYKGLHLAEKASDSLLIVDFYSALGTYYLTASDNEKALAVHLKCLTLCRKIGYEFGIVSALVDIGSEYNALHQPEKAVPYYMESKNYCYLFPNTVYEVQIYSSVGVAFISLHQFDSAYYYANKGYQVALKINYSDAISSALASLGNVCYEIGKTEEAEKYLLEALDLAKKVKFTAQLPDLYEGLRKVYVKKGNYQLAYQMQTLAIGLRDSLSNEGVRKKALEKEFQYNLEKKQTENTLLTQKNEIQQLQLGQFRYLLLGIALVVLIAIFLVYWYLQRRKTNTELQRILLEQQLLRAQMNPHFIFNSLNSIQQLIMYEQNAKAESYLFKFSKLIRNLLEKSIEDHLSIEEEVDILKDYLTIESLRFNESFTYTIVVDKQLDAARARIPHLMVQPFVENAIWHGLMPKETDRQITIRFDYHSEKTLRCSVDDTGIGRKASKKNGQAFKTKSLALSLIEKRVALLRKTHRVDSSIVVVDKYTDAGESAGTRVLLILPVVYLQL